MAATPINPTITLAGRNLIPNGSLPGFQIVLTHIAIGTGQWDPTAVSGASTVGALATALVAEVARYAITSGTKPTPSSLQIGTTITDTDSFGKSPNGKAIGELAFFSGSTMFAVWSRVGDALFVKSPQFDVPFAYTLDQSILPQASVSVSVTTDPAGMAALILQHSAQADPHTVYVKDLRGMGDYDPLLIYDIGAHLIAGDGKTYRSIAANNVGNTPQTSPTKWERWGHSVTEMGAEFVPVRTARVTPDGSGITRVSNPDGAHTLVNGGAVAGALKIRLPAFSTTALIMMRVDVQDEVTAESFSVRISGLANPDNSWSVVSASVIGQAADRDLAVRFGNDGTKLCIWLGELSTVWHWSRIMVSDVMVSSEPDGGAGGIARWSAGWQLTIVSAFAAVSATITNNLVFGQSTLAKVANLQPALDAKLNLSGGTLSGALNLTNGSLWMLNSQTIAFQSGAYTGYMRADSSGLIGFINQALTSWNFQIRDDGQCFFPRVRPSFAGQTPWDTGNFAPSNYIQRGVRTESANTVLSNGGAGGISGITQAGQAVGLTIANGNNPGASSVIGFLRDGQYGAFFGLDVDNQWAVGGWSMGVVRYRIFHEGNFDPNNAVNLANNANANANNRAPIRNGNANYGYVGSNTGNNVIINWGGSGLQLYVDNQYQGNAVTVGGGSNDIGGIAALRGSQIVHAVGVTEIGSVVTGADLAADAGSPWVVQGLRTNGGNNRIFMRCVWLRNQ